MADDKVYEVTVEVRDRDEKTVHHYEVPLRHASVGDVAVDIKTVLDSRSGNKVREINPAR